MQQIATDFVLILSEQIGLPVRQFKPADRFINDLKVDDLDTVEVVLAIEEHFKLPIPAEDAERLVTIQDFICYLHQRIHSAKSE